MHGTARALLHAPTPDLRLASCRKRWHGWKLTRCQTHLRRLRPLYHGIGMAAPLYIQVAFANVWLFGPLLKRWLVPKPEMNASMRTTTALTIIEGGVEDNTIPAEAKATVNFRLLPGDTIAEVLWHAKKVIKDERVKIKPVEGKYNEALPVSSSNVPGIYRPQESDPPGVRQSARRPVCDVGRDGLPAFCTGVRQYLPFYLGVMDESFQGLEHGIDERIPVEAMARMVKLLCPIDAGLGDERDGK